MRAACSFLLANQVKVRVKSEASADDLRGATKKQQPLSSSCFSQKLKATVAMSFLSNARCAYIQADIKFKANKIFIVHL